MIIFIWILCGFTMWLQKVLKHGVVSLDIWLGIPLCLVFWPVLLGVAILDKLEN